MVQHEEIKKYYDIFAGEYAELYYDELDRKPFDRSILIRFSELVKDRGKVCDVGCGPGEIARFLKDRSVDVFGIDISEGMVKEARRLNPDIVFKQEDMNQLTLKDSELAGVTAFYSIIHLSLNEVECVFNEFQRVICNGGYLLVAFHIGNGILKAEKGDAIESVTVDFYFYNPDDIIEWLRKAGFSIVEAVIRYPYETVEYQSKRAYILAQKTGDRI